MRARPNEPLATIAKVLLMVAFLMLILAAFLLLASLVVPRRWGV